MTKQQMQGLEVSPVVQQALGKLNVHVADLMEQINVVVKVLIEANVELRAKLDGMQSCQTLKTEDNNIKFQVLILNIYVCEL